MFKFILLAIGVLLLIDINGSVVAEESLDSVEKLKTYADSEVLQISDNYEKLLEYIKENIQKTQSDITHDIGDLFFDKYPHISLHPKKSVNTLNEVVSKAFKQSLTDCDKGEEILVRKDIMKQRDDVRESIEKMKFHLNEKLGSLSSVDEAAVSDVKTSIQVVSEKLNNFESSYKKFEEKFKSIIKECFTDEIKDKAVEEMYNALKE